MRMEALDFEFIVCTWKDHAVNKGGVESRIISRNKLILLTFTFLWLGLLFHAVTALSVIYCPLRYI